ncbi:MAG TPA: N-acetylmuramoyl-L-alanine amidase [Candidatus Limnocylindrales bacterium]|nr:N-acetylmuramoyl-L-alanine amidase [Candidatus Limnocylindrales bacterium]
MNKPAMALALFLAATSLSPVLVSAQRQTKVGDNDAAPRGGEDEQQSAPAPAAVASDKVQVTGLRFLSSPAYTRVMLDLTQEAKFEIRQLKEDAVKGTPPRIYIDIASARLALTSKEAVPVEDGLLKQIRIGQYSPDVVRVVLDMHSLRDHNAFILPDPYRLVVDLQGQKAPQASAAKEAPAKKSPVARKPQAKQKNPGPSASLSPGIRKIVLDPGHGGKDPGAIGIGGSTEKDIVLSVAKKLAVKLRREMGVQVVLTRKDDRFVALEDRTAVANAEDADLFISLHMNASPNGDARGLETYYLDNTTDEAALRLAARENGTSRKNVSDLQFILSDMTQNMKLEDSISLAHRLQGEAVGGMTKAIGEVKDLGVKKALFYVLVGARMPSVLIEMFFITNRNEGGAMSQEGGQEAMVEALMQGIQKYAQSVLMARTL